LIACCASLPAAPTDAPAVRPAPFVLRAAAAPTPALKYTLLPELRDTRPGNAAERYRKAVRIRKQDAQLERAYYLRVDQWMQTPLKDFPCDEVREFLKALDTTFAELDAAARCESCDWGLTERIREKGYATLLPDVQECREFAYFLSLKIRLEVAEH